MSLPEFRFNRCAYEGGNFVGFAGACDFCGRDNRLLYKGSIYVAEPKPDVCDECISMGRLAERYGADYPLFGDFDMDDADPLLREEVFTRTPGFPTYTRSTGR